MSDKATEVIDWLEQVAGVQVDAHQREVIRRLYDAKLEVQISVDLEGWISVDKWEQARAPEREGRVLDRWRTRHPLSVLGRSTRRDPRHPTGRTS